MSEWLITDTEGSQVVVTATSESRALDAVFDNHVTKLQPPADTWTVEQITEEMEEA